jgi:hypothetical protein
MGDKPTAAWYLAPIFLGILGSIIMWYVLKDEDHPDARKMAKKGWVIGIVLTLIGLLAWIPMILVPLAIMDVEQQPIRERMQEQLKEVERQTSQDKPITPSSWNDVVTFSSSNSKKTEPFTITGDTWRFTWSCTAENEYDLINIQAYEIGNSLPTEYLLMQSCPTSPETTYVYEGSGNYYFEVDIANARNWTIMVEET